MPGTRMNGPLAPLLPSINYTDAAAGALLAESNVAPEATDGTLLKDYSLYGTLLGHKTSSNYKRATL